MLFFYDLDMVALDILLPPTKAVLPSRWHLCHGGTVAAAGGRFLRLSPEPMSVIAKNDLKMHLFSIYHHHISIANSIQ